MRLYAPEKMVGTNPQYWIMQAQHISEGNFIPQTSGEENQDTPSSPILQPRRETRDQRNRPPHMRTRPNTAQGTGEIRRVPNSFQGFTFPGENHQGRSERTIYIPLYLRPQPAQSVNEESSSISATAPPQPQDRVLNDAINQYHKAIAGRTQSTPIEVKDSQNTPENHTNRAMSSSKRSAASRIEERDEDTSTPKRQRQSWNSMEQQYDRGFFKKQDFDAANGEATIQNHTIQNHAPNFAPVFDTSQMNSMPRKMHYRKNPHLRPHDVNGNVLDVGGAPPVPQRPIQGQQARDQERVFDDRGGDGVDVRAGVEMQDDVAELARLQAQMQKVLDRQKHKELPAQQQPQQTPHCSEASKKPSPPRLLSDEELRRQQALLQHFQAKSNQRIEHGHGPQLRSRSTPAQTSPPSSAMHSQRPLLDIRNSPHLLWNVESMSSQADLQHQPSQHSLQYPHQQPLSRAPFVRVTDRPGNPVARELSSGRPTTEYGNRRVMSSESGISGQGGRYRSDNWEMYSEDGEDANDFRDAAPGRAGMNGGGRQYGEELRASSNAYEQPSRFDDGQGFYAPLRTQQDGLNDRYMQQSPQAQPRMHHFGQDQRSPSGYHEFDDNPHGNEGSAHARDMLDDQYQRPAPVHLWNENRNESQRLHSFGSHERMRREQQFDYRELSDDSMYRQPQHEYRARDEQRMRQRQNTAERNDTSGRETHDALRSMRAHHGITDSRFDETRRKPSPLPFSDDFHIPREPQTKKRAIMNDSVGIPPHHRLPVSPPPSK